MLKEFREFILRGNLVDLAVAVVIGTAFGAVVAAFVKNIVTPLIAAIGGQPDFSSLDFTINGSRFQYGLFFNAVIAFLLIALIVFFLVVRPYNHFRKRFERGEDETVPPPEYVVETADGASIADALNRRSADGWRVVSVGDAGDGRLSAVLVKGDA